MSLYVLIPVILFAFCIGLLLLLIISGLRHSARRPFTIFLAFMAFWGFFIFLMRYSDSLENAFTWEKWVFVAIINAALFFYRFVISITNAKERNLVLYTVYILYLGSMILIPTGLVVKGMQMMWYGKAPVIAPLFFLYVFAVYVPIVRGMIILIKHYRQTRVLNEKVRDSYIILGIVFLLIASTTAPLGTPTVVTISTVAFLIVAAVFQPIQSRVQRVVDKWFFRGRYDHLHGLELFTRETKNIVDLKQLSDSLLSMIGQGMESRRVYLLLPSTQSGDFETYSYFGQDQENVNKVSFPINSMLTRSMKYQDNTIDVNDIDYIPSLSAVNVEDRRILTNNGIELLVPLRSKELLTGILLLTHKTSGESYSMEDRQLLNTISNQAAVSIENARLYDQLQQQLIRSSKLASLGELATNVAHEVNNSLQSVINYGTILYEDLADDNPLREDAKIIESEAIRARNIVEILLGIARKERTTRETVDLNDVVKSVVTLARLRAKSENILVQENYSLEAPMVKANAEQLRQVFLNLFTNATDAMPQGGKIDVSTTIANKNVIFTVTDTGMCIPQNAIEKIFDPLYTTKINGTGLGLTVSRSIVEEHGGTIEVESEENKGTTFT